MFVGFNYSGAFCVLHFAHQPFAKIKFRHNVFLFCFFFLIFILLQSIRVCLFVCMYAWCETPNNWTGNIVFALPNRTYQRECNAIRLRLQNGKQIDVHEWSTFQSASFYLPLLLFPSPSPSAYLFVHYCFDSDAVFIFILKNKQKNASLFYKRPIVQCFLLRYIRIIWHIYVFSLFVASGASHKVSCVGGISFFPMFI